MKYKKNIVPSINIWLNLPLQSNESVLSKPTLNKADIIYSASIAEGCLGFGNCKRSGQMHIAFTMAVGYSSMCSFLIRSRSHILQWIPDRISLICRLMFGYLQKKLISMKKQQDKFWITYIIFLELLLIFHVE